MLCQKCTHSNPDENKFCGNCGAPLPATGRVTLKDILAAGLLKAGDELTISFRGKDITATLLADGKIKYENKTYDGPLAGAIAARGQTCDGWYCWNAIEHATGKSYAISHYRGALLRQKREGH
ncbi:MAG: zinc ribbon domain-containing protein [Chloroflexi bacterium]|nr:zinc ribbon domain-containing protein [Chloroflexota bacterium]